MGKVFISYTRSDSVIAEKISKSLTKHGGVDVFKDDSNLIGPNIETKLISNADAVIILLSEHSKSSSWISLEIEQALAKEKLIIPILIGEEGKNNWIWPLVSDRHAFEIDDNTDFVELGKALFKIIQENRVQKDLLISYRSLYIVVSMIVILVSVMFVSYQRDLRKETKKDIIIEALKMTYVNITDYLIERIQIEIELQRLRKTQKEIEILDSLEYSLPDSIIGEIVSRSKVLYVGEESEELSALTAYTRKSEQGKLLQYISSARLDSNSNDQIFRDAFFGGAKLIEAELMGAKLIGVNLTLADLRRANLRGTNLRGANLRGANLRGANLREANLREANLTVVDLRSADLRGAELIGADLTRANLAKTDLTRADLRGADLTETIITYEQLLSPVRIGNETLGIPYPIITRLRVEKPCLFEPEGCF